MLGIMRMSTIFDYPVVGVTFVVLICVVLFVPTVVAHFRRIRSFQSVSALNALALLMLFVCTFDSLWFLWGAIAIWAVTTIWSVTGRRRDA